MDPDSFPFVPQLAISMDEENKKNYLRGSGTRGRFTKPWTVALLDKLWEVDRTVGVAKGLYPRGDVNEDIQVRRCWKHLFPALLVCSSASASLFSGDARQTDRAEGGDQTRARPPGAL